MIKLPEAIDSDTENVVSALDTARALWQGGEHTEAIRWVQKAASAAEEAGDDRRALELARTSADLSTSESEPAASAHSVAPEAAASQTDTASVRTDAPQEPVDAAPPLDPAPPAASATDLGNAAKPGGDLLLTQAVRVSVKRSVRDPELFIARKLEGSDRAPPGTREALIVLLDSAADLDDTPN